MSVRKREWKGGEAFVVDLNIRGKRHRRQFSTRKEALTYELEIKTRARAGTFWADGSKLTLAEICPAYEAHLEERKRRGKRMTEGTLRARLGHLRNYIIGGIEFSPKGHRIAVFERGLGDLRFEDLTYRIFEEFFDAILDFGRSVKTAREIRGTLISLLDFARRDYGMGANPARGVAVTDSRNAKSKRRIVVPPKRLIASLLGEATGFLRVAIMVAAYSGIRAGEQWALRWKHVDWHRGYLRINTRVDAWGYEDGQGAKTESGNREIPLSSQLLDILRVWRGELSATDQEDLIFPNDNGTYRDQNHVRAELYYPLVESIILRWTDGPKPVRPRWHDLRHFAVSCWIEAGMPAKAVQEFAGHASLSTTMDIYGHLFPSDDHHQYMDGIAIALGAAAE
ncbi:MAG: site-specific integrase [Phenylobacterium sp.]|uniref:site-specific integrase n=1 Tax=Phenylobacterium sp. TaxID=1871053 RepID=UPI001A2B267D|nr:site-specific integrase [Phenylobacterium sp.]MBJ7408771.1 site-specific integrase [Phenylobacterium sp.]